ncbi:hypothetical protein [Streptomyces sp. NBC_01477]|uniref:hypothetical protein n=1 Tax=Streptomyces sp. NBC_01477 TaxID=2976015 RepID=UPI002E351253|nr:hypothetical protein [Streptomyces sp. NBC_01477]
MCGHGYTNPSGAPSTRASCGLFGTEAPLAEQPEKESIAADADLAPVAAALTPAR